MGGGGEREEWNNKETEVSGTYGFGEDCFGKVFVDVSDKVSGGLLTAQFTQGQSYMLATLNSCLRSNRWCMSRKKVMGGISTYVTTMDFRYSRWIFFTSLTR